MKRVCYMCSEVFYGAPSFYYFKYLTESLTITYMTDQKRILQKWDAWEKTVVEGSTPHLS